MPSPSLYAARQDGAWVVHEARSGASLPVSPLLDACLTAFEGGRTRRAAVPLMSRWPRASVSSLIEVLVTLETRDPDHRAEVVADLGRAGFRVDLR